MMIGLFTAPITDCSELHDMVIWHNKLFGVVCDAQPACELSPIVVVCERFRHQPIASLSRVFRYSGAVWLRQRNTRTAKRNWMRSGTRSQCKSRRSGVIRSYLRLLYTSLAAALSTDCRRSIRRLVMPLSVTLS